ncbi:MBL fold metallo-hydrolase [Zafaria cholistanensis]|uniref:MBL fold metallo-hydrolase n=1 Tax=Zafaria cholistanensis TaxID=1682741 RepID=UPI001CEC8ECE|nr:MBL fold metallo-hydrolase [Zafaria cholistanensis]
MGERSWVRRSGGFALNAGLVVGDERALLVDTGSGPAEAAEIFASVRALTDLPLVVANTHAHGDHFFGNAYFRARGVEDIWAHSAAVRMMEETGERQRRMVREFEPAMAGAEGPDTAIELPNRVVEDQPVDLDLGGHKVTLFHLGRAHTDGDLLVGSGNVLFAGDIVEEGAHPSFEDSFPYEWQKVLGKLIAIDELYTVVVPGHGDVVDQDFVRTQFRRLLQAIRTTTTAIHESSDYTKAVPVLPYGPVQSRHLILRMKATGSGSGGTMLR